MPPRSAQPDGGQSTSRPWVPELAKVPISLECRVVQRGRKHGAHTVPRHRCESVPLLQANRAEHPGLNEVEPVFLVSVSCPAGRPVPKLCRCVWAVASLRGGGHNSCLTGEHGEDGVQDPAARVLIHSIKGGLRANTT
eukprot:6068980-Amphidinium_carterae.1